MNKEKNIIPYRHQVLSKSNFFIGAKYKASTLENQITYLAMYKIQEREYEERPDGIYVSMSAAEIRTNTENNGGGFYQNLVKVANEMTGNNLGVVNEEEESFEFITMINKATYNDGVFEIRFANELHDYLIDIEKNFTPIPKEVAMKLKKRPHSFPLYQILKQQCYYPKGYTGEKNYVFLVVIGLSELKLDIGIVSMNESPEVRKALLAGKGTEKDFDNAVSKSKNKMYNRWADFDRKCLRRAVDEINEKSDIYVEYEPKKKGKGGKTYAVQFTVWLNGTEKKNKDAITVSLDDNGSISQNISEEDKFMLYMKIFELLKKYDISYADASTLADASNYNLSKIENAYKILENTGDVENIIGWLVACIKGEWEQPKSKKKKNEFNNFQERDWSSEESESLEKKLLGNR